MLPLLEGDPGGPCWRLQVPATTIEARGRLALAAGLAEFMPERLSLEAFEVGLADRVIFETGPQALGAFGWLLELNRMGAALPPR